MSTDAVPSDQGAPSGDRARWTALVEKTLGGASFADRLTRKVDADLTSQPLYVHEDAPPALPPRLRGAPAFDAERRWDIRVETAATDPATANAEALEALAGGATSLLLRLGAEGRAGTRATTPQDMDRLLQDVHLDLAPVALDAGLGGLAAARLLVETAERRTLRPRLQLHMDPFSAAAETGMGLETLDGSVTDAAAAARALRAESALLASGRFVHEAGGGDAQELGVLAAALIAYLRALTAGGDPPDLALARIVLSLSVDQDYFLGMAKIRAARRIFEAAARSLGVGEPQTPRIEARSSLRMLSGLDVNVNMLRLTASAFAAGAGGADILVLAPYDTPLGAPSSLGRRQARNIQLVLMQEGGIADVRDPSGGSFYVERLGRDLAHRGWEQMQAIERLGGLAKALAGGALAGMVRSAADERERAFALKSSSLVGVTDYPNLSDALDTVAPRSPSTAGLTPLRLAEPFEALRRRAAAMRPAPRAFLALLGAAKEAAPRAAFAANALAVAGVAVERGALDAYEGALAPLVVLCGSDAAYEQEAASAVGLVRARGGAHVLLAGRDPTGAFAAAGVAATLHAGMDQVRVLNVVLDLIAETR